MRTKSTSVTLFMLRRIYPVAREWHSSIPSRDTTQQPRNLKVVGFPIVASPQGHGHVLHLPRLSHALHRRLAAGAPLPQVVGARRSRRAAAAARHPRRVRPLGDRRPRRQRHPRNQRHHLRLLRLPRPNVQADVPCAGRAGRGQEGQTAPGGRRVRAGGRGPPPRAGPRRVGPADAHVPGGQRPRVPALGADGAGRRVPLRPRQGAGAAAGGRRAHRRLRQRHAQPAPHPAHVRPDQPRAVAALGRRVRRMAQGVPPRRQARGRQALPGEGAVRGGGAPAARPLLPAARRARRRWGRVRGGARPP